MSRSDLVESLTAFLAEAGDASAERLKELLRGQPEPSRLAAAWCAAAQVLPLWEEKSAITAPRLALEALAQWIDGEANDTKRVQAAVLEANRVERKFEHPLTSAHVAAIAAAEAAVCADRPRWVDKVINRSCSAWTIEGTRDERDFARGVAERLLTWAESSRLTLP